MLNQISAHMKDQVNAAFQIIPGPGNLDMYRLIDRAISVIITSGMRYRVCPFETVVEGPLDKVLQLVPEILEVLYSEGVEDVLSFVKIQSRKQGRVTIEEKMAAYDAG